MSTSAEASEVLKAFVVQLVGALVPHPDGVTVLSKRDGHYVRIHVFAPEEELGRLIGRNGQIAKSLRTIVSAAGTRLGVSCELHTAEYAAIGRLTPEPINTRS